ncbi:hypothetical protein MLD38_035320 [Melastoma candidum]|uniref:Uncharacterized protein n=1 Tax=Melastoma candidum TaxID=119954 RepID=A0ACB9LGB5_9MYRT|nr:hypothetical protein MLD38_035320 [Melastoma candidum]
MATIRLAFVLLCIISISGISDAIFEHKSVVIKNDLGSGLLLALRCLSADDDLGNQLVPPGETWGFHFRTTFPGTTLFHCGFKWALADEKKFAVYETTTAVTCARNVHGAYSATASVSAEMRLPRPNAPLGSVAGRLQPRTTGKPAEHNPNNG